MILNKIPQKKFFFGSVLALCIATVFVVFALQSQSAPEILKVNVLSKHPHDRTAFTQGLLLHNGKLYESTGLNGQSTLRIVDPESGEVEKSIDIEREFFAEGLTLVDDKLIQITWKKGVAFVYNVDTFERIQTYTYQGQGWGLCYDGTNIYMSDGSPNLFVRDPNTFDLLGQIPVTLAGKPLPNLNELEFVNGFVYANVWQTNNIVKIDPASGKVVSVVDAANLLSAEEKKGADVLNGIAYDPETETFLITGKHWPTLFKVKFESVTVDE